MSLDRDALDRHITGGRYSADQLLVTCGHCGEKTTVVAETDYGMTTWSPEECTNKKCNELFNGDEEWDEDEPDPDRMRD